MNTRRKTVIFHGIKALCAAAILFSATDTWAQTGIMNSPAGGQLPAEITPIGGITIDLVGKNGTRIVSELAAGSLYNGWSLANTPIGIATGFTTTLLNALGGGLSKASFRVTLWDGDSASGDFDYQMDTLTVNGVLVDNFSNIPTTQTDSTGSTIISTNPAGGFRDSILDTGFFSVPSSNLSALFSSLQTTGSLQFSLNDATPGDNNLDFTQGIAGRLAYIGYLPGINSPIQVLQNSSPINTPTYIDYVAMGQTITGTNGINTVNSLDFAPGSSFGISGTLIVTSGSIHSQSSGTSSISGGTLTSPGTLTFDLAGDQQVSSTISGSDLVKTGTATLILSGSNTYTGTTTVSQGTLQIGNGVSGSINSSSLITVVDTTGTLAFNMADYAVNRVDIVNNGTVKSSGTNTNILVGVISGTGTFYQSGSGVTILTATNTYTGPTVVANGSLVIGDGISGTIDPSSTLSVQSEGTLLLDSPDSSLLSRSISNDGTVALMESPFTTYTFTGEISGTGTLVKTGSNTLILSGSNSYSGLTIVEGGVLQVASTTAIPSQSAVVVISGGILDVSGLSVSVGSLSGDSGVITGANTMFTVGTDNSDATFDGIISGSGTVQKVGNGVWTVSGSNTYTDATIVSQGMLQIGDGVSGSINSSSLITVVDTTGTLGFNMGNNAVNTVDIVNNGTVQPNGANTNILAGVISGTGTLYQGGSGVTILTATNTYTGPTIVANGILKIGDGVSGTIDPSSALSVQSAGTLLLDSPDSTLLNRSISNNGTVALLESPFTTYTFTGEISGTGAFIKTGTNTLILSGSNSYSGMTIVEGGVLRVTSTTAIPSQSAVQVISGATLDISGISQSVGSLSGNAGVTTGSNTVFTIGTNNSNATFAGAISGSGTVQKVGNGVWTVSGSNTYTGGTRLLGGTILVNGSLQSDVLVMAGILGGGGIIHGNVTNQAMVSPGNSPGVLTIAGNYTQSSTGSLLIQIASPTSYDQLVISGTADLGGTLLVSHVGNTQLRGSIYTFLTAASGISGTFADISSASLLKLTVIYGANSVELKSMYRLFGNTPGMTLNESAVAGAIDAMLDGNAFYNNKKLVKTVDYLNDLPIQTLPAALEHIVPTDYILLPDASFATAQTQASNLERRMEEIRSTLVDFTAETSAPSTFYTSNARPSGDGMRYIGVDGRELAPTPIERRWGFFLNGSGEYVSDKCSALDSDGKFNTGGLSMGADYRFNDNIAAGLTVGYANTTTTGRGNGSVGIDSGDFSAYATAFNQGFFVNGVLGGASSNYTVRRESLEGLTHSDTTGMNFHALLGGGYSYSCEGFSGGPIASLRYSTVQIDGFSENGSLAPLDISSQSKSSFKSTFGFQVGYEIPVASIIIKPQAKAQWLHEFSNDSRSIDASFQSGSAFTVNGPALGSDSFLVDLGATVMITPAVSVYVFYSGDLGSSNYTSSTVFGGVQLSF